MSRFQTILLGKKARKTIEFPAPLGAAADYRAIEVDLIVLTGNEEASAIQAARAYATKNGVEDPREGDPHFDLGLMVHTLVRATVEHDPGSSAFFFAKEPESKDFDAMAEVVLEHLDRERITYLYQLQQVWQEECSPWGKGDTEDQILAKLQSLRGVSDPTVPFKVWRPATVGSLLLTLASRLPYFPPDKSGPGSFSATSSPSSTKRSGKRAPRRGARA